MLGSLALAAVAAAREVALVSAQGRSLVAVQGRPLGAAVQEAAWAGLAQGPLGMAGMKASQVAGFLQGTDTFHTEEQAAGWKGAAQNPQGGLEGNHPQEPQGTDLACWLLQTSRACWLPFLRGSPG